MKTFKDLKFHIISIGGVCGICELDNGCEIAVAMAADTCGGDRGLWEIVVFKSHNDIECMKLKCLADEDVEGYLTTQDVEEKMIEIQKELECIVLENE